MMKSSKIELDVERSLRALKRERCEFVPVGVVVTRARSVSDFFEEERDDSCAFFPLLFITKTCEKKVVSFGKPPCVARESVDSSSTRYTCICLQRTVKES